MTERLVCDSCGDLIDEEQPHFLVTAQKMIVQNANDPTTINVPELELIPRTLHYHDGHQPELVASGEASQLPVLPEEPGGEEPVEEPTGPEPPIEPPAGPPIQPPGAQARE